MCLNSESAILGKLNKFNHECVSVLCKDIVSVLCKDIRTKNPFPNRLLTLLVRLSRMTSGLSTFLNEDVPKQLRFYQNSLAGPIPYLSEAPPLVGA